MHILNLMTFEQQVNHNRRLGFLPRNIPLKPYTMQPMLYENFTRTYEVVLARIVIKRNHCGRYLDLNPKSKDHLSEN
jgi:hypothetical protein